MARLLIGESEALYHLTILLGLQINRVIVINSLLLN